MSDKARSLFFSKQGTRPFRLRAVSSFFLVRRAKRPRHANENARDWRRETEEARNFSSRAAALVSRVSRLHRSTLARACTPLIKSEETDRLLAVYRPLSKKKETKDVPTTFKQKMLQVWLEFFKSIWTKNSVCLLPEKNQVTKFSEPVINEDWGWSEHVGFHTWCAVAVILFVCLFCRHSRFS